MKKNNLEGTAHKMSKFEKDNENYSGEDKSYIITEEQIRSLLGFFTNVDLHKRKLVISSKSNPFTYEAQEAMEDNYFFENNVEEYERLQKQFKSNEIVVYEYTPYTMQEMFELVQTEIDEYEKDDPEFYQDEEFCNLVLMKDIIEQNIK